MSDLKRTFTPDEEFNLEEQKFLSNMSSPNDLQKAKKVEFNGLSKEELLRYGADPTWVRVRWLLFILFWLVWFAMLASAVLLIVFFEKCPYKPKLSWPQKNDVYAVSVEYFRDFDGNGVGDFDGVYDKSDYIKNTLGMKALYLRDALTEQNVVDTRFGDEATLKNLYNKIKEDMHIILSVNGAQFTTKEQASETARKYLSDYADGLIVKNVDQLKSNNASLWSDVLVAVKLSADGVTQRTARVKYVAFEPLAFDDDKNITEKATVFLDNRLLSVQSADVPTLQTILQDTYNSLDGQSLDSTEKIRHTWVPGTKRIHETVSTNKSHIIQSLALLSYGSAMITYGDEIGLKANGANNAHYMLWDSSPTCGFSTNKTTLPSLNPCNQNVKHLGSLRKKETISKFFASLIRLRQEPAFLWGKFNLQDTTSACDESNSVLAFTRYAPGFDGYLVAANLGDSDEVFCDFRSLFDIPAKATLEHVYPVSTHMSHEKDVETDAVTLYGHELLVLKYSKGKLLDKISSKASIH